MSALTFKFDNSPVNVIDRNGSLWFVAADVVRALHLSNTSVSLKALRPFDKDKIEINGKETNIISEGGMYFLTLRSQDALKEGTPAYRFSIWVTNEVLPAIRKQGHYECPAQAQLPPPTLTEQQAYAIMSKVAMRAKRDGVKYQTIYRALKARYQVTKYTHIPRDKFEDALEFIRTMNLNVPEAIPQTQPEPVPERRPKIVVSPTFCENMRNFIFIWNYLHRDHLMRFLKLLKDLRSPYAEGLSDAIRSLNMDIIEHSLADIGFSVKELDCYKYWAIKHAK